MISCNYNRGDFLYFYICNRDQGKCALASACTVLYSSMIQVHYYRCSRAKLDMSINEKI